jgi:hypothetical protein
MGSTLTGSSASYFFQILFFCHGDFWVTPV